MLLEVMFLLVLYTVRLKKGAVVTMLPYDFVDISNNQDEINEKKDRKYIN